MISKALLCVCVCLPHLLPQKRIFWWLKINKCIWNSDHHVELAHCFTCLPLAFSWEEWLGWSHRLFLYPEASTASQGALRSCWPAGLLSEVSATCYVPRGRETPRETQPVFFCLFPASCILKSFIFHHFRAVQRQRRGWELDSASLGWNTASQGFAFWGKIHGWTSPLRSGLPLKDHSLGSCRQAWECL